MCSSFTAELAELQEHLLTMSRLAETAVQRAVQALVDRDDRMAARVIEEDSLLDSSEVAVDNASVRLLAMAPPAFERRFVAMAMKISHNLERVGDEATTIARRVLELNQQPTLRDNFDLPAMAAAGLQMLSAALESFLGRQPENARSIIPKDKEIDATNKRLHRELASYMVENPTTISRCLNLMVVAKSLERIGDHAKNIAEEVVYLCEGRDIRHQRKPRSA